MHTLSYKIRPKHTSDFIGLINMVCVNFTMITVVQISQVYTEVLWERIAISLGFGLLVALSIQRYFKPKFNRLTLNIDNHYIATTSNFINKLPHCKPIHLQNIDKVEYAENLVADPALKDFKRCLIIYSSQTDKFGTFNKRRYIIAESTWQIDDFNELIAFFTQLGYPPQPVDNQQYIQQYAPESYDLGERTGYLAIASMFLLFIAGALLLFLDNYYSLDFGNMQAIFMGVAVIIAIMSGVYLYKESKQFKGFLVLPLFVPIATFLVFSLVLLGSPIFGKKHLADFDFKGGVWQYDYQTQILEIDCQKDQDNLKSDGQVNLTKTLGMIRIDRKELTKLCLNGKLVPQ